MSIGLDKSAIKLAEDQFLNLKYTLESKYPNYYVVINPYTKEYFVGLTLGAAMREAKNRFPDQLFFGFQIGAETALSFS